MISKNTSPESVIRIDFSPYILWIPVFFVGYGYYSSTTVALAQDRYDSWSVGPRNRRKCQVYLCILTKFSIRPIVSFGLFAILLTPPNQTCPRLTTWPPGDDDLVVEFTWFTVVVVLQKNTGEVRYILRGNQVPGALPKWVRYLHMEANANWETWVILHDYSTTYYQ